MLPKLAALALAGGLGTLARHGLASLVQRVPGLSFPLGTLTVNMVGCFMAGLLWSLFEHRWRVAPETRLLVLVGFMGAFTTFSTFILETGVMMRSDWLRALANVTLQNGLGFAALVAGVMLARWA